MSEEQNAMLLRLQQLSLTMVDLAEYLDTHPADDFALQRYDMTAAAYRELMSEYSNAFGPLTPICGNMGAATWQWASECFPWDC